MSLVAPTEINMSSKAVAAGALLVLAGAAAYLAVGAQSMTGLAVAATSNQSNVTLSVASTTSVNLDPDVYNFSKVTVGSTNFSDTNPALNLIIKNDGSNNITDIYAHIHTLDSEQDNPLGTGAARQHASGKFLWIENGTATSRMYHAGAISWNITEDAGGKPAGMQTGFNGVGKRGWGFYRNATGDYLWAVNSSSTGYCNGTGTTLRMKNAVDTGNNRDLTESDTTDYSPVAGNVDGTWGVDTDGTGEPVASGPLNGHYVAMHESCTKFFVFRFDNHGTFPVSGNDEQFLTRDKVTPGEEFVGAVGAALPQGIPAGSTNQTTLTIFASSTS